MLGMNITYQSWQIQPRLLTRTVTAVLAIPQQTVTSTALLHTIRKGFRVSERLWVKYHL
jgi:hypothetical protein